MSQTRANVIFLLVLVAVMTPGAVMMFRKMMQPGARVMSLPDGPTTRLPHMAPFGSESGRYVPVTTGQWVEAQAGARTGRRVMMEEGRPVISGDRILQVIAAWSEEAGSAQPESGRGAVALLVWDEVDPAAISRAKITATAGGRTVSGTVERAESIALPAEVRKELMEAGYPRPPVKVVWIMARFERALEGEAELRMEWEGRGEGVRFRAGVGGE